MLTEELLNHIESKATDWNNHPYYRFYFVFRHHRYALHIAEQTKRIKISNGSVMITEKLCPHYYRGTFTDLEKAFDVNRLNQFYNEYITIDLEIPDEEEEKPERVFKFTDKEIIAFLGFNPTTTFIIEKETLKQAKAIAQKTQFKINTREGIVNTLTKNGFWDVIKGIRIVGKKQTSPNRVVAIKPIFESVLNPKVLEYQAVLDKVAMLPEGEDKTTYLKGLRHKYNSEVIVIDWKGNNK